MIQILPMLMSILSKVGAGAAVAGKAIGSGAMTAGKAVAAGASKAGITGKDIIGKLGTLSSLGGSGSSGTTTASTASSEPSTSDYFSKQYNPIQFANTQPASMGQLIAQMLQSRRGV